MGKIIQFEISDELAVQAKKMIEQGWANSLQNLLEESLRYYAESTQLEEEAQAGVWTDPDTGLMWMRHSLGQTWDGSTAQGKAMEYSWEEANEAVLALNNNGGFAGYTDWRLPDIDVLKTLVIENKCHNCGNYYSGDNYSCPDALFKPTERYWDSYWSASLADDGEPWSMHFCSGREDDGPSRSCRFYVRVVRAR